MRIAGCTLTLLMLIPLVGCETGHCGDQRPPFNGEAQILGAWQGDYPVAKLNRLPEAQRKNPVGFLGDTQTFIGVWDAFNPGKRIPAVNFNLHLILYARNTKFYNPIAIGKIKITNGVVELLVRETRSARPIDTKVAMSMVLVARQGITGLLSGNTVIQLPATVSE